jgi:hypothetical protein
MQIQGFETRSGESKEICGHFRNNGAIVCNHPDGWGDCILNRPDRSCPYKNSIVEYFEAIQEGEPQQNR